MNGNASASNMIDVKVYLKDSLCKVIQDLPQFKSTRFLNTSTGVRTNLTEKDGRKWGFVFTRADEAKEKRIRDSVTKDELQTSSGDDSQKKITIKSGAGIVKNIIYEDESKMVNNIICKKAVVTTEDNTGEETKITVWYTSEYTFSSAFVESNAMMSFAGFKGLPVYYEAIQSKTAMGNDLSIIRVYQLLEFKTDTVIADTEFDIPQDYQIKSYSEWVKDNPRGVVR
jgi:hypothetical protein